jgi:thymidylate synthase
MNMNNVDKQYLKLLQHILECGEVKGDRTGTGTISIFDYSMTFDMSDGFPLLTSKKVFTKAVIHELIWFLRGDTNIKYLVDNDVHIWDGDAYKSYQGKQLKSFPAEPDSNLSKEEFINKIKTDDEFANKWGELGPVYGKQWRRWGGYKKEPQGWHHGIPSGYKDVSKNDQITDLIDRLKNDPDSRRLMVNAWNVGELDEMVLPPCHFAFQCYTSKMSLEERIKWWCDSLGKSIHYGDDTASQFLDDNNVPKRKLSLKWFQRSVDSPLGLPFNIASYAILLHLLSKEVNMVPHQLKFNGGDCHIYMNQIDGVKEQLHRETYKLPKIKLLNNSIFDLEYDDIQITKYDERIKTIKFPLSN